MCGIAGIINEDGAPVLEEEIKAMTRLIAHRGPDHEGFYFGKDFALGHRRLRIIDLSDLSNQPMKYVGQNGEYVIVYNGEIYNYIEIRDELIAAGYRFSTQSDTEVILASYDRWGLDCVNKFNGIWAFAIYDQRKNLMFLSRDRFGVKPLYYTKIGSKFCFGSEIKQFTTVKGWRARMNHRRVYDYLTFNLIDHTNETMFEGVYQLRGGEYLLYDLTTKRFTVQRWYDIKIEKIDIPYEEAQKKFRELVFDSVRLQLRSDVKVGSCLSGGLDSSTLVSVMRRLLGANGKIETVSFCSEFEKYNEEKYVDEVVKHTNVVSHKVSPKFEDFFAELNSNGSNEIESLVWHQDEPFGSASIFAQYSVFKEARKNGIIVMLDGQGADEILAGYHSSVGIYLASLLRRFKLRVFSKEFRAVKSVWPNVGVTKYVLVNMLPDSLKVLLRRKVGGSRFFSVPKDYDGGVKWMNVKNITEYAYKLVFESSLPALLHWEDRNSMAFSVESRVPYLDYRIVEFLLSLPESYIIRNGYTKAILRDSMRGIVPDKILDRKDKIGFATPEEVWMRRNRKFVLNKIQENVKILKNIVRPQFAGYAEKVLRDDGQKYIPTIWKVINVGEWVKTFSVEV
ncbi:asparagine synthase [Pseudothermotoga hypogea DSM 11164 = NBRC 106472]|uniref:asparagine synthase (glutamine-hydrolyzing) n=1 Tax=Pseudothermotoga hypogea DSM 11164 = NBRC 106472 TaxID=1123384 RepID=A0A0X1KST9_9THEM|nr:asparagine synthase (glutamine-hydrolyzing) [Pseudothermotoga hypogea]AJC74261.1 asparagine synthase [Pseudothermotoga hypogea DSM 11164 = NBRC 106472]